MDDVRRKVRIFVGNKRKHFYMKQEKLHRTAVAVLIAGIVLAALPALYACLPTGGNEQPESQLPMVTASPDVPAYTVFAGDTVRFDRADLRERMDREQCAFTYMHSSTLLMLKRANRYFPVVEPILKEEGVPDDFKYLMAIESSLDVLACSPAKACGLWQFMEGTARDYGLEVNAYIDERYHTEKATRAACRYLKDAYAKYGDWLTVAASYNAGQGRISRELNRQGVDTAVDLWLNPETSRYMFRLLALKEVFTQPKRFGFCLRRSQLYPPMHYRLVDVDSTITSLTDFARSQGVLVRQLKEANPWIQGYTLHNRTRRHYVVAIPDSASLHYRPEDTRAHDPAWVID